jgi:GAF domain-containing protein
LSFTQNIKSKPPPTFLSQNISSKNKMEHLDIPQTTDKATIYRAILPQIQALVAHETDVVANLANVAAVLRQAFGFFWVGFYIVKGDELVVGPYQGTVACSRRGRGRGVCGAAWVQAHTLLVPDVEKFEGHIACSSASKSEVVVPCFDAQGTVWAVLDIDSDYLDAFDATDQLYLEKITAMLAQ